jgi:5-methylcytosine-specific restriction endonuclease McrBC regulatory subunit McrC
VADLNDVAELHDSRISIQSVSRQHPHLSPALEIGQLLLADASGNFGSSSHEVSGFLWNSDDIFESAMRRLVSEVVRPIGLVASKRGHRLLKNENFTPPRFSSTFPDIDVYSGKKSRLVLDAKYKVLERMPSSDDAYQILAAGRVAGVSTVGLIYPGIGNALEAEEVVSLGGGLPERIILIRVGLSAFSTRARLNELKRIFRKEIATWLTHQSTGPALLA